MNTDPKDLNKMLATLQYTEKTVYQDKAELIPGIQGWINIQKSIYINAY